MGIGIAAVFGRLKLWKSAEAGEDGRPSWLEEDEPLLRHGPANRFRGLIAIGGWLYLTDRRLYFDPHRVLQSATPESWDLDSIAAAQPCQTLLLVPNGLRVVLKDASAMRFVVGFSDREGWVVDLQSE
jgi:hypothetical protein